MAINLRSVAHRAGVSVATASRALRGLPHVKASVREAVAKAAQALDYETPPLVGSVLSHVRRGRRAAAFSGSLAVIHVPGAHQPALLPFQLETLAGGRRRALELGFSLDVFDLGISGHQPAALGRMLLARGIAGVIVMHQHRDKELDGFPWERFPAVEFDYSAGRPALHTVCIDHHLTLGLALRELARRDYRRPGLAIEHFKDDRIDGRWSGAFTAHTARMGFEATETLVMPAWDRASFVQWFNRARPDVVIGHRDEVVDALGGKAGFLSLNKNESRIAVAGLDLRPELQGAVAIETVVALIQRHESGPPAEPRTTMVAGRWVEGPTLR